MQAYDYYDAVRIYGSGDAVLKSLDTKSNSRPDLRDNRLQRPNDTLSL